MPLFCRSVIQVVKIAFKPLLILSGGSVLAMGAGFVAQALLARVLGAANFGVFVSALSIVTTLVPLASLGVGGFLVRVFTKEGWGALRWLPRVIVLITITTSCALVAIWVWALFGPNDEIATRVIIILAFYLLGQVSIEFGCAISQLEERHIKYALFQAAPHVLRCLLVGFIVLATGDPIISLYFASYGYAFIAVLLLVFGGREIFRVLSGAIHLRGHDRSLQPAGYANSIVDFGEVMAQTLPFAVSGVFYLVHIQGGQILLKYLINDQAAGVYNAASLVIFTTYMIPSIVYQKYLLPKTNRLLFHDRQALLSLYRFGSRFMLVLGIVVMIVLWLGSDGLILLIFGEAYGAASAVLRILVFAIPIKFLSSSAASTLISHSDVKFKAGSLLVVSILNAIICVLLIPDFGMIGAALSMIVSEAVLLVFFLSRARLILRDKTLDHVKA